MAQVEKHFVNRISNLGIQVSLIGKCVDLSVFISDVIPT